MRIPSLLFVLIAFMLIVGACGSKPDYTLNMNNPREDVKELIEKTLRKSLINERNLPGYDKIRRKGHIYISNVFHSFWDDKSTEHKLTEDLIPEFQAYRLYLMSPEELYERTKEVGDYLYLQFGHIKIANDTAYVELATVWATDKPQKAAHLSEGGYELKFTKHEIHGWIYLGLANRWTAF